MGSFPYKYVMLVITNVIELRMGKLILNHLIGNNYPEFRSGLLDSYFFKLTLGSDYLELCFSALMPSLNSARKLPFELRLRVFIINVY